MARETKWRRMVQFGGRGGSPLMHFWVKRFLVLYCEDGPINYISGAEVETALRAKNAIKGPGPSWVSSDLLKFLGRTGITLITKVFQQIIDSDVSPEEWKDNTTLHFIKIEGDPHQSGDYPGLRLLEHGMKLWEMFSAGKMKRAVSAGKSTTDAMFILRDIQEKYTENRKNCPTYS